MCPAHTCDAVSQILELVRAVQHLNALSVRVVAHGEGSRDSASELPVGA